MKKEDLFLKNTLICGDNLKILPTIEKESIDLIYIDPPFFSNRNYEIIWGDESEIKSFKDRWEGGINVFIEFMRERVIELHRVLKPTGSFYLHCDWHAGHYLKVMCDEIFGANNFINEIVWCYSTSGRGKREFSKKHDTILFYSKTKKYYWNDGSVRIPYTTEYLKTHFKDKDAKGKRCRRRFDAGKWRVYYPDKGMIPNDWWVLPYVNSMARERLGYPTQKPEALLERIIKASSKPGDLILDAFCGCGTALAVAHKLRRRWTGIDISPSAVALIKNRMKILKAVEDIDYNVIGMPKKIEDVKDYKPFDFQYWIINEIYGYPSPRKVGDMGIDGLTFLEHRPIQVKQSEHVGRNVVDNFETAIRRYCKGSKEMKGYILAFSFTKGAYEEIARVKKEGIEIKLVTVQDVLDKKFITQKQEYLL